MSFPFFLLLNSTRVFGDLAGGRATGIKVTFFCDSLKRWVCVVLFWKPNSLKHHFFFSFSISQPFTSNNNLHNNVKVNAITQARHCKDFFFPLQWKQRSWRTIHHTTSKRTSLMSPKFFISHLTPHCDLFLQTLGRLAYFLPRVRKLARYSRRG